MNPFAIHPALIYGCDSGSRFSSSTVQRLEKHEEPKNTVSGGVRMSDVGRVPSRGESHAASGDTAYNSLNL